MRTYANNVGMANVPRFTDDEGARKEGLPGMILPGNMSAALIGKLVGDWAGKAAPSWCELAPPTAVQCCPNATFRYRAS